MKIEVSRLTIFLEKSHLYRWLNFFLNLIIIYLGLWLINSDIKAGNTTVSPIFKILTMIVIVNIHLLLIANLSQWISIFLKDRVEIASLEGNTLKLNLERAYELNFDQINNIEFTTPSIFHILLWPYARSKVLITLDDQVEEIETLFKLDSLSRFFTELNKKCK
ncbi:MAG: hypothetical protein ACK4L8_15995 [Nitrincola lacisaponensis]|uniref:hypothetical protein n=1 Tax=Nitrincola lacisaponensis TaxID=267850 RepID=UPI00391BD10B